MTLLNLDRYCKKILIIELIDTVIKTIKTITISLSRHLRVHDKFQLLLLLS